MKKLGLLFAMVVLMFLFAFSASAATEGYYTYSVSNGEAAITDVDSSISGDVVIPSTLGGYNVTSIGFDAFRDCISITSVKIPDGVVSINTQAFLYCSGLTSVTIPNSVIEIGYYAFGRCTKLTSITIPDSVLSIGQYSFLETGYYNDTSNWENGLLYIGNHLIEGNTSITSCEIRQGTKTIADYAFQGCASLTSITIPDSITAIGQSAFNSTGYYKNESNWEDELLYIGNHLVKAKTSITFCNIRQGTKTIAAQAFYNCTNLTSIRIPEGVTNIFTNTFGNCTNLTSITIPESVINIFANAFSECKNLSSITVDENNAYYLSENGVLFNKSKTQLIQYPAGNNATVYTVPCSVTLIRNYAFNNCENLTSIAIPSSVLQIGNRAFDNCTNLTSLTIPNGVKLIGLYAFYNCTGLTTVSIPESVEEIGNYAFYNCTSLTELYLDKNIKHIGWYAFSHDRNMSSSLTYVYFNGSEKEFYRLIEGSPRTSLYVKGGISNPNLIFAYSGNPSKYAENAVVAYGSYPQSRIVDDSLIAKLNKLTITWTETENSIYSDVEYLNVKYRAVLQNETVLWYKFEPILWRVLNPDTGLVLSERILDKQKYSNTDNNYKNSNIRKWLNDDFYNDAFSYEQKNNIATVTREIESYNDTPTYGYEGYSDETVFLVSAREIGVSYTNPLSFSWGTTSTNYVGALYTNWWLRTPTLGHKKTVFYMSNKTFNRSQPVECTVPLGVRPAICLDLDKITCEHFYSQIITAPTCTSQGYTTFVCPCGDSYIDNYVDVTDHTYTSEVSTPATHLTEGVETFTCECGNSYTKPVAKLEKHEYTSEITTPATHLTEGVKTFTCECGDSYTEPVAKLEGHTYTSEVTTEPTHLTEGVETFTCACGDSYTEPIAKLEDHIYTSEVTTEPTHLTEGVKTFTCACGSSYTEAISKTKEHSYVVLNIVEPTCESEGYTTYMCECGYSYNGDKKAATGHNYEGDNCKICGESKIENCNCNCHKGGFNGFIWKILCFFYKIFGSNKVCACGAAHY